MREDPEISAFVPKWQTLQAPLRVLAIIHNVTSATRMMDVLPALEDDPRVQTVLTWTRSSPFRHGVEKFLDDTGYLVMEWEKALEQEFDLAIGTSLGGDIHKISAPFLRLPHGMGYNKYLKPEIRKSGNPEIRKSGNPVFGLSREWLLHDGEPVPAALALSHDEQAERLAADCPEALPRAFVAGDPCHDRILAGFPHRARYRRALGVRPHQQLVLISSTWGTRSLFGRHPGLPARLLGSLPQDEYRVALALHPNIWHGHGPGQVDAWLARARRAGLIVLPPNEGWRAAIVASDAVVGDHGSVSYYSAAAGRPVVLDTAGHGAVAPDSPIARLLETAVPYTQEVPVEELLRRAHELVDTTKSVAEHWVSSRPRGSLALVRSRMYDLMGAEEPEIPVATRAVPAPVPEPGPAHPAQWVRITGLPDDVLRVRRIPAAAYDHRAPGNEAPGHLAVRDEETDERLNGLADLVLCHEDDLPEDGAAWARSVFTHRLTPAAAVVHGPDGCVLHGRDGTLTRVRLTGATEGFDPSLLPLIVHHAGSDPRLGTQVRSGSLRLTVEAGGIWEIEAVVTGGPERA
ncbi:hypothetical protein GCM10007147_33830 [Nocardiopsis kunsanensis]|uniref:Uncharacterized protein n=1 Tax=Nocardiopsis kunsanensis TaxID=141693 RepID=A0A919CJR5_9ACTN|nr:hypothetical protein [Nocardiopsis kunsanensis]GHD31194.1 hypothetical protein GCM10007147_33830 [Nocardiopsis kunsanensis]